MAEGKKPKTEKTIIEYAYENRDKTFSELPFNDIDNVILSEISYISFENVIADEKNMKPMTLHELLLSYFHGIRYQEYRKESSWFKKHLFLALAIFDSPRYRNLKLLISTMSICIFSGRVKNSSPLITVDLLKISLPCPPKFFS